MYLRKQLELTELQVQYDNLLRSVGVMNRKEADMARERLDEMATRIQSLRKEVQTLVNKSLLDNPES